MFAVARERQRNAIVRRATVKVRAFQVSQSLKRRHVRTDRPFAHRRNALGDQARVCGYPSLATRVICGQNERHEYVNLAAVERTDDVRKIKLLRYHNASLRLVWRQHRLPVQGTQQVVPTSSRPQDVAVVLA